MAARGPARAAPAVGLALDPRHDRPLIRTGWAGLTPREQTTIVLICRGCTVKEAAYLSQVSHGWIKNTITSINRKLGTTHQTEIVAHAARHWPWIFRPPLSSDDDPVLYG